MVDFENDLLKLKDKLSDKDYAVRMYRALCNNALININEAPEDWKGYLEQKQKEHERRIWLKRKIQSLLMKIRTPIAHRAWSVDHQDGQKIIVKRKYWEKLNLWILHFEMKCWDFFIPPSWIYSCSWRYAGSLMAEIRAVGEDYMSFYCSGYESEVFDDVRDDLLKIGWAVVDDFYDD